MTEEEKLWDRTKKVFNKTRNVIDLDDVASIIARFMLTVYDNGDILFTTQKDFGKKNYIFRVEDVHNGVIGEVIDDSTGEVLQIWDLPCAKLTYHKDIKGD